MAIIVPPIVVTDVGTADAQRGLTLIAPQVDSLSATKPELWVFPILQLRTAGQITLRGALVLARHLILQAGVSNVTNQWAVLAATECLGQVDCATLTTPILGALLRQAHNLSFLVLGGNTKTVPVLRGAVNARKTVVTGSVGDAAVPWLPFLDRVADALTPVLGQKVL